MSKVPFYEGVKKNFGFGFMRLPMIGEEVDLEQVTKMVDLFMEKGFNYFDTAHPYLEGKSEIALRESLVKRYPRDSYFLVNKLSEEYFTKEEDIRPLFEVQLEACGVEYFDLYLMHSQRRENYEKFKRCRGYETAFELKKEGKVKHVGLSFHDRPEVLEQMLNEYPDIEVVQIQFNYLDYEDAAIEAKNCYDVCVKYNKPVIVMEPVKGGNLVNLPEEAKKVFDDLQGGSYASYAIRYAASFDQIVMVLSGMSNMEQIEDNLSFMQDFEPIKEHELEAIRKVCEIIRGQNLIQCTGCRYCVDGCPKNILIPELFADYNEWKKYEWNGNSTWYYEVHTDTNGKISDCVKCGKCEKACPQHLKIRDLLVEVETLFESLK